MLWLVKIGPRGLQYETNFWEIMIMGWEYFNVVTFDLGPLFQDQMRTAKLKNAYNFRKLQPLCLLLLLLLVLLCSGIHMAIK